MQTTQLQGKNGTYQCSLMMYPWEALLSKAPPVQYILYCTARYVISCAEVCLPVMCSTSKLPVKTHDQATDYMVNLPIQNNGKKSGKR